ncbi:LON peptidase substrate-binding domain-containing protein [Kineococcus sp. NPDC059986]|uniref:LON peptidase substrate-binding domain-containing protein n=1 Tax=Kineococcus sp. NPDC059986 TaxID=3155538 RepID=UPI003450516C
MPQRLPLFPLGSVLFPGLVLPLNVFEPRYRVLVQDLVGDLGDDAGPDTGLAPGEDAEDADVRGFGVVAIKSGHEVGTGNLQALHTVGCVALVREVSETEDGRYEIVTVGASRFRLVGIDESAGTPYLTGLVEPFGDDDVEDDDSDGRLTVLADAVSRSFDEYRDVLDIGGAEAPDDPRVLSYLVAAAAVLDVDQRQRLLEAPDTVARLQAELELLRRETSLISTFGAVPATELPVWPVNSN